MKHFQDENYDSMRDYETNLLNNADDYKDGDYYGKPIIHYEDLFGDDNNSTYDSMRDYEFSVFNHND